ncbi:MAG TPA: EAL domain-containing protein, partial [Gammaproteobacteria bacterium]|nr:EAL domain-containing protein [Gammaproteobacteria bacterium]
NTLLERGNEVRIQEVPGWFVDAVEFRIPPAEAAVTSGWQQAGKVKVWSHPGYAYRELWRISTRLSSWFGLITLSVLLAGAIVLRLLLRPLRQMENQAEALASRRYTLQERLPRTRELRSVVQAMNHTVRKVHEMFDEQARTAEHLKNLAFRDPLTGLANRRFLDAQLDTRLRSPTEFGSGALLLVRLNGLQRLNEQHGYEAGDALVTRYAGLLKKRASHLPNSVATRLGGGEFALLLPDVDVDTAKQAAADLAADVSVLKNEGLTEEPDAGHVGGTVSGVDDNPAQLFARADLALREAEGGPAEGWQLRPADKREVRGRRQWEEHIRESLEHHRIRLFLQPVLAASGEPRTLQREVLVRISDAEGDLSPAGTFIAVAQRLGLATELDRQMVTAVLLQIYEGSPETPIAINLSGASIADPVFVNWLMEQVNRHPDDDSCRFAFELPEYAVAQDVDAARRFVQRLREAGCRFGLDHFGRNSTDFGYLHSLRPDYVKIDGAYTAGVTEDKDRQFFVRVLCSVAHSLDVQIIAEMVEDRANWERLAKLGVDGIQGFAAGRPQSLSDARH